MQSIRRYFRARRRVRALIVTSVTSTTIALTAACDGRDVLPTMPPIATHSAPHGTIDGADVTTLGFDVAAINDAGQVAGTLNGRAVRWTPAQGGLDLGTLGGASSRAY